MKDVYFKVPKLIDKVASSKQASYFEFKGVASKPVKIIGTKVSCACTTPIYPNDEIKGDFTLILKIDKSGSSGKFNQSCAITFSNGQTELIYVTGTIDDNN